MYKGCDLAWCTDYEDLPRPDITSTAGVDFVLNEKAYAAIGLLMQESGDFYVARLDGKKVYMYLSWKTISCLKGEIAKHHIYRIYQNTPVTHHNIHNSELFISKFLLNEISKNGLTGLAFSIKSITL